jgi:hypothetical protein
MTKTGHPHEQWTEVKNLALSRTFGGVMVFVRCLLFSNAAGSRYELHLRGEGKSAIVDVPGKDYLILQQRIDEAVVAFVEAIQLSA